MGDMSGGNFSLNKKMISQQYFDFNNGDVCKGYGFKKRHTISQCEGSNYFQNIDDDNEKGDGNVISGYGF